ncbi:helix-turn-helix domain-containing protein [Paenibacillus sp. sgz302251]|uniref:helix-turn-helix domain-containing protein n=1 Tax=Paenibacillus sp. sgz302251 TaxID=3414493 RepID=UPI003C79886E
MKNVEKKIKELRAKRGWSQDELAGRMGMTRANISNYERGLNKNIPSETLKKLADVFGVSADYLLGKSENSDKPKSEFMQRLELSDEEIMNQYTIVLDGKTLTEEEARFAIAVLRTNRQMKS